MAESRKIGGQRPVGAVRGYCHNLLLDETGNPDMPSMIVFPFRPTLVTTDTSVSDDSMDVMGMSHQYKTYKNTTNTRVAFDLYMNALMMMKEGEGGTGNDILEQIKSEMQKYRRFLQALLYPGYAASGIITAQQPPCILVLPGICTLRMKLKQLGEMFEAVFVDGEPKELRMRVAFEEAPMARVSMEEVMMNGMFRTWGQ